MGGESGKVSSSSRSFAAPSAPAAPPDPAAACLPASWEGVAMTREDEEGSSRGNGCCDGRSGEPPHRARWARSHWRE